MGGAKDLADPYLGGFGFSRPGAASLHRGNKDRMTEAPKHITLDGYHHPSKRRHPSLRYIQAFDLYSYVQYPLLNRVLSAHQHHLKSTNTTALDSG